MGRLSSALQFFVRKKIAEDEAWRRVKVVVSGHEVPGEGEHKIQQYIRHMKADAANWDPGYIISDSVFYDSNAMSASEIQAFLNAKVPTCRSTGVACLKDHSQATDNRSSDRYCNGYTGRLRETAAQIIDNVARSCGISQKVLLVLLEKEQSLVTSSRPTSWSYQAATGQGCPDTEPCDPATSGFFYQVYYAARQYEIYRLSPSQWGYQAGRWNNILYSPQSACGTQRVYIQNQATAGLYIYTPYTPNQAALNNLYGEGDGCSTYGNRNFWRFAADRCEGSDRPDLCRARGPQRLARRGQRRSCLRTRRQRVLSALCQWPDLRVGT